MKFSSPLFLYMLPLALFPIVIHLISSLMRRRQPFPYVKLLRRSIQQQRGMRRIQDLLLAIVRSLALFFLILFAAGPYVVRGRSPERIVVDVSASMTPYMGEVKKVLSSFPDAEVVYVSLRAYDRLPAELLYPLKGTLLDSYRDSSTLLVSDFQMTSVKDTSIFLKHQVSPVENPAAILGVSWRGDSALIRIRGGDYLEVRRGDSILSVLKADSLVHVSGLGVGPVEFLLFPLDAHDFDNVFHSYSGGSRGMGASVVADGVKRRLLEGLAEGIFGSVKQDGDVVLMSGGGERVRKILSSGRRVIYFGSLPEVSHTLAPSYTFRGVILDSVFLFDGKPYTIVDNLLIVGIPPEEVVLNPSVLKWFRDVALSFAGRTIIHHVWAGQRVDFSREVSLISPSGEILRGSSITFLQTGCYHSPDYTMVVCSNVDRGESSEDYYRIGPYRYRRIALTPAFLGIFFLMVALELMFLRTRR